MHIKLNLLRQHHGRPRNARLLLIPPSGTIACVSSHQRHVGMSRALSCQCSDLIIICWWRHSIGQHVPQKKGRETAAVADIAGKDYRGRSSSTQVELMIEWKVYAPSKHLVLGHGLNLQLCRRSPSMPLEGTHCVDSGPAKVAAKANRLECAYSITSLKVHFWVLFFAPCTRTTITTTSSALLPFLLALVAFIPDVVLVNATTLVYLPSQSVLARMSSIKSSEECPPCSSV